MKLYEIDAAIMNIMDQAEIDEFGELIFQPLQERLLQSLEHDREKKIESIIAYYKDIDGDIEKFDTEIKNLNQRKQTLKNKKESLKNFIDFIHQGAKGEYGVHKVSYRKSTVLEGNCLDTLPLVFIKEELTRTPLKNDIKEAIKSGQTFEGWSLTIKDNIQIK